MRSTMHILSQALYDFFVDEMQVFLFVIADHLEITMLVNASDYRGLSIFRRGSKLYPKMVELSAERSKKNIKIRCSLCPSLSSKGIHFPNKNF